MVGIRELGDLLITWFQVVTSLNSLVTMDTSIITTVNSNVTREPKVYMLGYVKQLTRTQRYKNSTCFGKRKIFVILSQNETCDKELYVAYFCPFFNKNVVKVVREMG
jgi:hypothetical protein